MVLKKYDLFLVGIDIIGQQLIKINTISPTGLILIKKLYKINMKNRIETKLKNCYNNTK